MKLKTSTVGNGEILVLEPRGSLVGGEETDELKKVVTDAVSKGNRKVVIDLSEVTYLNSSAIGALVSAHTSYLNRQGKMFICSVNKNITNIFVITKLASIFNVAENREEALIAIAK